MVLASNLVSKNVFSKCSKNFTEKKFMEAEEMKEEVWTIKVSIGQIIELANKLNIKYSA